MLWDLYNSSPLRRSKSIYFVAKLLIQHSAKTRISAAAHVAAFLSQHTNWLLLPHAHPYWGRESAFVHFLNGYYESLSLLIFLSFGFERQISKFAVLRFHYFSSLMVYPCFPLTLISFCFLFWFDNFKRLGLEGSMVSIPCDLSVPTVFLTLPFCRAMCCLLRVFDASSFCYTVLAEHSVSVDLARFLMQCFSFNEFFLKAFRAYFYHYSDYQN